MAPRNYKAAGVTSYPLSSIGVMKQKRCKFWMCYVDGGGVPTHKHWEEDKARAEAERLARETGKDVFLLEAYTFVRIENIPPTTWHETMER